MGDSCEACGWAAAVLSMVAFGSFGAPIKSQKCKAVNVDPLVFQSYKTFMCFATSWLVLLTGKYLCMIWLESFCLASHRFFF